MSTTKHSDGAAWWEWAEWYAHKEPAVLVLLFASAFPAALLGWPGWAWPTLSVIGVTAILANRVRHRRSLCTRCAAKTPINPAQAVARSRWALWLHHRDDEAFTVSLVLIAAYYLVPKPFNALCQLALFAMIIAGVCVDLKHRPLARWCPYCPRWGGGDDGPEEVTPTPRPTPVGVKQA